MELWERETSQYHKRLDDLTDWKPDLSDLIKRFPSIPIDYSPSEEGIVSLQLSIFIVNCIRVTNSAVTSFLTLFHKGLFITISLPARFIFELWGAAHFVTKVITEMQKSGDVETAKTKSQRITLGARSDVNLPWGGQTDVRSVHVMDLIRSLNDVHPQAEQNYDFLYESCHPSHLRLTTWILTEPMTNNWNNVLFRKEAHNILERTVSLVELSLKGISNEAKKILETTMPIIESDQISR